MDDKKILTVLQQHLPAPSVDYCFNLWQQHRFHFVLRKGRITKVGDFTYRTGHTPRITVNHDLNPYLFLVTYIHEVAHLDVHSHFKRAEAHGEEWKNSFRNLLLPVMTPEIFPENLLNGLDRHMVNPKASTFSDSEMTRLFRSFDKHAQLVTLLSEVPEGTVFGLHGRWFRKGKMRRTRVLCRELTSKKNYLVPADVPIENAQLSLL